MTSASASEPQRLALIFRKGEEARFLSHLDLLATLEYALRRAGLPLELSEGFNPRPKMSVAAALPLGHIGEREVLEVSLRRQVAPNDVRGRLQAALPPGITILDVTEREPGRKLAASRLESARYRVELREPVHDLSTRVDGFMARSEARVEEERDGKTRTRDIRPFVLDLTARDDIVVELRLRLDNEGTIRPEQVLEAMGISAADARFIRESLELS